MEIKKALLLVYLVFVWSSEFSMQDLKCEMASKEVCGYESWECSARKCFIQNNYLEQAYQLYFEYLIQREKQSLKEYNRKESLSLYVYEIMQKFSIPKIDDSVENIHNNNQEFPTCHYIIEHTIDKLVLKFNKCHSEENIIIFKKEKNGFKITDLTEAM